MYLQFIENADAFMQEMAAFSLSNAKNRSN